MVLTCTLVLASLCAAQLTTGTMSGTVTDASGAVVANAKLNIRNLETGLVRTTDSSSEGRFYFSGVPLGRYELTAEAAGFGKYVRGPIQLLLNQDAVVNAQLRPAAASETITVSEDAPIVNTVNSEVGVRFDERRLTDLPTLSTSSGGSFRDVFSFALSAPGVSQINNGNAGFASGVNFAVNGMRPRGNNFMVDGQDSNDPSITGRQQNLNNPDIIKEFRVVTNQPPAEFGRSAGSVVSVVTKGGTNQFHGSGFWFHNDKNLNSPSNLDKLDPKNNGDAPFRLENQYGGTFGGPIFKNKTFFFGSYQRWTDGQLGAGSTIIGVPTDAGRQILQNAVGTRPQVAALLNFLPAATAPVAGATASFCTSGVAASATAACPGGGTRFTVPLGSLSGSNRSIFSNDQFSIRIDQTISSRHTFGGRYLYSDSSSVGGGQANPPGNSTIAPSRTQAMSTWLTSTFTNTMLNEVRLSWQRLGSATLSQNPASETIPSIEVPQLGLNGFNAAGSRTAVGLAVNLPQARKNNTYQLQDTISWNRGRHAWKFGADIRNIDVFSDFNPTIRGRLSYSTLDRLVNDLPEVASINKLLPGGKRFIGYRWWDNFYFVQDTWQLRPSLSLNLGLRYENPGNALEALYRLNDSILNTNGGNSAFRLNERPGRDNNNFQPRVGFNWNPRTRGEGILGALTGGDKLVVRGGYARTNDYLFINLALNVATAFPFQAAFNIPNSAGAFTQLAGLSLNPATASTTQTRTTITPDFHTPSADQFSFEVQRGIGQNNVVRLGYVGTLGNELLQTLDGNPVVVCSLPVVACPTAAANRVDPSRFVVRLRGNRAESNYHSMQLSYDRRFARGFSAGAHYTWSKFIDTASDTFNPSGNAEIAIPQNSFNIKQGEYARSAYDRPHRVSVNGVWELPFYRSQQGVVGHIVGGWQMSGFLTLQSGSPFTALNGADPSNLLSGISGLVGVATRPNLNTNLNVGGMTLAQLLASGGASLWSQITTASITAGGPRLGNSTRNNLRSDGINNVDFSFGKNVRITEHQSLQFRADAFNLTNTRNYGIPISFVNNAGFANEKTTDGGNRRMFLSLHYMF
jgi:hypothetical protein